MKFKLIEYSGQYSKGAHQHPLENTTHLVGWFKEGLMMAKWKYMNLRTKAKKAGVPFKEYLSSLNYTSISEINKNLPKKLRLTRWIGDDAEILRDGEYRRLFMEAKKLNNTFEDHLRALGYVRLLDPKIKTDSEEIDDDEDSNEGQ